MLVILHPPDSPLSEVRIFYFVSEHASSTLSTQNKKQEF
jgi:hypothetical protein